MLTGLNPAAVAEGDHYGVVAPIGDLHAADIANFVVRTGAPGSS